MCVQEGRGLLGILLTCPWGPGGLRVVLKQELNFTRDSPQPIYAKGTPY